MNYIILVTNHFPIQNENKQIRNEVAWRNSNIHLHKRWITPKWISNGSLIKPENVQANHTNHQRMTCGYDPWAPFNLLFEVEIIKTWRNFCWKPTTYKVEKKLKGEKADDNNADDQCGVGIHISSTQQFRNSPWARRLHICGISPWNGKTSLTQIVSSDRISLFLFSPSLKRRLLLALYSILFLPLKRR